MNRELVDVEGVVDQSHRRCGRAEVDVAKEEGGEEDICGDVVRGVDVVGVDCCC